MISESCVGAPAKDASLGARADRLASATSCQYFLYQQVFLRIVLSSVLTRVLSRTLRGLKALHSAASVRSLVSSLSSQRLTFHLSSQRPAPRP
jgi:hypothetical protein